MDAKTIELREFTAASIEQYRGLICDPNVIRHMPLAEFTYTDEWIHEWILRKASTWENRELGPWSLWHESNFVGWAGLEPEEEDLSLGMVLHKTYWGSGERILKLILAKWDNHLPGKRVIVEFPKSRKSSLWAKKLGLLEIDEIEILSHSFVRYELILNPQR